uniref:FAD synthase n=1 Tax=Clastoptera arizonana TaxID=38151 RepID=A0A1B6D1H1_9HEMI
MDAPTAGIIVIGDEILKGNVQDTNSNFICKRLYKLGVQVKKISVIDDSIVSISKTVADFSHTYNFVITSGGIGPTHDDVTLKGIATAFNEFLYINEDLLVFWKQYYDDENAKMMSSIPNSSNIIWAKSIYDFTSTFPIINIKNVFIFPGIPKYLQISFEAIEKDYFENVNFKFNTRKIYLNVLEGNIVDALNKTVDKFEGVVNFGSYPKLDNPLYKTEISMESINNDNALITAENYFKSLVEPSWIVNVSDMYNKIEQLINNSRDRHFASLLQNSIKVVEESLLRYPSTESCISFNGGKDCTAVLHLVAALYEKRNIKQPIHAIYFHTQNSFTEVDDFIIETVKRYDLTLTSIPGPIKPALEKIIKKFPSTKVVFMGSRKSDPKCDKLQAFQMTDPDWPQVMRVSPMLEWSHADVWTFLKELSVPYCSLYDNGFTSLGNKNNTKQNPKLMFRDESGKIKYKPAYTLSKDSQDRDGRT